MLIALDYDGTYTADPGLWNHFVDVARSRNHEVHIVTMRADSEPVRLGCMVDRVHYTNRKAKRPFMEAKGLPVQIWIDDMPDFILGSAAPRDLTQNAVSGLWTPEDVGGITPTAPTQTGAGAAIAGMQRKYPCPNCNMDEGSPICLQDERCPCANKAIGAPKAGEKR